MSRRTVERNIIQFQKASIEIDNIIKMSFVRVEELQLVNQLRSDASVE